MRAFVTGAGGFVGKHLLTYLSQHTGWELYGSAGPPQGSLDSSLPSSSPARATTPQGVPNVRWLSVDLTDREATTAAVEQARPDIVFHLAAQSNVQRAFQDPQSTIVNNIVSELNLLEALRKSAPDARIMITGSSEQYGLV